MKIETYTKMGTSNVGCRKETYQLIILTLDFGLNCIFMMNFHVEIQNEI